MTAYTVSRHRLNYTFCVYLFDDYLFPLPEAFGPLLNRSERLTAIEERLEAIEAKTPSGAR